MRNKYFRYGWLLSAAVLLAACSNEDDMTPDTPTEGYRWTFGGGLGADDDASTRAGQWTDSGNQLTFSWKYDTTDEMVFAVSNPNSAEDAFLAPLGQNEVTDNSKVYHTYMSVNDHPDKDDHWAVFKSMSSFATPQSDLDGHYLYAVTPIITDGTNANGSLVTSSADAVSATLVLPSEFQQTESGKPDFLHKYMYMSATATLDENGEIANGLNFEHIPATFRFKVTNKSGKDITLDNIKVSATKEDGESINLAPQALTMMTSNSNWEEQTVSEYYKVIMTTTSATVSHETTIQTYTAYALLFPGVEFDNYENINITATINDTEQSVLAIRGEQLMEKTQSHKLLSGNLYTFNLTYNGRLAVESVTVNDWEDIWEENGGIAEEKTDEEEILD